MLDEIHKPNKPMKKNQSTDELAQIESCTLAHYDENAQSFWLGTQDHDVSQNIQAFLGALPVNKKLDILDFGCGPGRDLITFKSLGHRPVGLDGSQQFCFMAKQNSGCETIHQAFLKLDLAANRFDGIFANASLFHVPSQELLRVLNDLHSCLRPQGILFSSNPRGNDEGWQGSRYAHYMELAASEAYLQQAGFKILQHYYRPAGQPRHLQPWLAIVSQRLEIK